MERQRDQMHRLDGCGSGRRIPLRCRIRSTCVRHSSSHRRPHQPRLQITADDRYTAFINGDKHPVAQGSDWTTVQQFNVTHQLFKGQNLFSVRAVNSAGPAGVLYRLQITMPTGKLFILNSSSRVKVSRRPNAGWSELNFVDTSWPAAREIAAANAPPWGLTPWRLYIRCFSFGPSLGYPDPVFHLTKARMLANASSGDRMLMTTSVSSSSDSAAIRSGRFYPLSISIFKFTFPAMRTRPIIGTGFPALAANRSVSSLGLDWCYSPHNAFPPEWYRKSVPFTRIQCLEHHFPVQACSPWDPTWPGFVDKNYDALPSKQFSSDADDHGKERLAPPNSPVLSAICVGIHGDYGEAGLLTGGRVSENSPGQRAAWERTFGNTHDHIGWWCDDVQARKEFQRAMLAKYGNVTKLNESWKVAYKSR